MEEIKKIKPKKIFFDMDGVLSDFDRGVEELCHFPRLDQEIQDERELEMWARIKATPHFFRCLKPMEGSVELFRELYDRYGDSCEILTGVPKPRRGIPTAGQDKTDWIRSELNGAVRINLVQKAEKVGFCTGPDCILLDDFAPTIRTWRENGGTGILFRDAASARAELIRLGVLEARKDEF